MSPTTSMKRLGLGRPIPIRPCALAPSSLTSSPSTLSTSTSSSTTISIPKTLLPHTLSQTPVHFLAHTRRKDKSTHHHQFTGPQHLLKIRKRRNRNGKKPPPNVPIIMSQAALNARSGTMFKNLGESLSLEEGRDEDVREYLEGVQMGHVDEFVGMFFGLGLLRSDIPIPRSDSTHPSEDETNRLALIFHTWLAIANNSPTPKPSILLAKSHGHILGRQLLAACLNKGVDALSLYHLVQDVADFYSEYCQDLEVEAKRVVWERGDADEDGETDEGLEGNEKWGKHPRGMGRLLKLVLGRDRVGVDIPGWGPLIRNANKMFALMHGATKEIGGMLKRAAESGI
ncbi:hypothetical protein BKA65DRAFT_556405 [Rhexocercosporidium sp. MPI-PUGE-AT-0058]|nr:hypothetical protein BKA65DRAFT_556405 [Rhexocercosporidium sp. MPI-PUGE-AT-0058]